MAERELAILVKARDLATPVLRSIQRETRGLSRTIGRGLSSIGRNIERGMIAAGGAAVAGIGYALKSAGDFEAQLNTINTVAQVSREQLGAIGDGIRDIARATGTSHEELTTAYYDLVSAGIKAADAQDVLVAANQLAIGGLATTAETVDLLTTAINSYGGDASKAAEYADQFAQAIAAGKVTAAEIAASFSQVGPLAAAMGIGVDEVSASLGLMTAKGTPAAEAFTQMRAAMIALQRQTPEMKRVLKELGIADAQLYADTHGLAPLYDELRKKADELGIPLIKLTGRVEGTQYALQNTGDAFDEYTDGLEKVRDSSGTAADQMSERQQGLNYQLGRMKTLAHDAAITVGSALLPKIVPRIQALVEWLASHQDEVAQFAQGVASGFDEVANALGRVDWKTVGAGLGAARDVAKALLDTFLKMPPWVQTAIVTGWGLNKLSGGALGSILGQVTSGLIKGILGINAGVVNVKGAVVNAPGGGGGGVGGPMGGGKGFLPKGIGGWAGLLGIAALDALLVKTAIDVGHETVRNVDVGAQFEKDVVAERSEGATVEELKALRADLQAQMAAGGGDPLADVLKAVFVNSDLEDQIEDVEREIRHQTLQAASGQGAVERTMRASANSTINEFRRGSNERREENNKLVARAAAAASSDVAMLETARTQKARLEGIEAKERESAATQARALEAVRGVNSTIVNKDMSPTVKVDTYVTATTNISINEWRRKVVSAMRAKTGTGFQPGVV